MYIRTYAEASFLVAFEKGKKYTVVKDAFEEGLDVRPCPVAAPLGGKEERKREKMQIATFFPPAPSTSLCQAETNSRLSRFIERERSFHLPPRSNLYVQCRRPVTSGGRRKMATGSKLLVQQVVVLTVRFKSQRQRKSKKSSSGLLRACIAAPNEITPLAWAVALARPGRSLSGVRRQGAASELDAQD